MFDQFHHWQQQRRIRAFWEWFAPEAHAYARLNALDPLETQQRISALAERLRRIHPSIGAQLERQESGACEMIVTAGGDKTAFEAIRTLVAAAPPIGGWKFTALRQPMPLENLIFPLENSTLTAENIWYTMHPVPAQRVVDVVLAVVAEEDMTAELAAKIGYLCLDAAIGEAKVATGLGQVQFYFWPAQAWDGTLTLNRRQGGEVTVECKPLRAFRDDFEQTFKEVLH